MKIIKEITGDIVGQIFKMGCDGLIDFCPDHAPGLILEIGNQTLPALRTMQSTSGHYLWQAALRGPEKFAGFRVERVSGDAFRFVQKEWITIDGPYDAQLGQIVRDRLSGLQGTAVSRCEYITGCTQIGVAPDGLGSDGSPRPWQYFDWQRLEVSLMHQNKWADVRASEATAQSNGPDEHPTGKY